MQKIEYSPQLHAVKTSINSLFESASFVLGWGWKAAGVGFNQQIIDTVLNRQADLIVYLKETDSSWIIRYPQIVKFLDSYNTDYWVRNGRVLLKVIAWDWFVWLQEGQVS